VLSQAGRVLDIGHRVLTPRQFAGFRLVLGVADAEIALELALASGTVTWKRSDSQAPESGGSLAPTDPHLRDVSWVRRRRLTHNSPE